MQSHIHVPTRIRVCSAMLREPTLHLGPLVAAAATRGIERARRVAPTAGRVEVEALEIRWTGDVATVPIETRERIERQLLDSLGGVVRDVGRRNSSPLSAARKPKSREGGRTWEQLATVRFRARVGDYL